MAKLRRGEYRCTLSANMKFISGRCSGELCELDLDKDDTTFRRHLIVLDLLDLLDLLGQGVLDRAPST
ncbi:hypothetical protein CEB3_c27900 [Peptococcaceae bacterium CEB3]|nr:hypothetical protein CEB3_c27900 [Peptococcaceae bacterium CEB3]